MAQESGFRYPKTGLTTGLKIGLKTSKHGNT